MGSEPLIAYEARCLTPSPPPRQRAYFSKESHVSRQHSPAEPFAKGLAELRELSSRHRCPIMCAEAVCWRCHRRIISDYLLEKANASCILLGPVMLRRPA
ncbi:MULTISPECIES: DUF488 domain-containing protein [Mesorhizobium]|uniref:DUF488 domain-containing protein n=1 Tax=Mesorhizobium ciceri TaxID=39645 RepID=A0AB38TJK1_9HYPH|nr:MULTISPECIES: DUF488 domain-containing protein [Mesorhizobium]MDF3218405.1 DUF488 domain-containing protein [Mesorhizobium ciceri]UTU55126.1 DUF488 domain-containing protein [Mesorhizobium ciceri]